MTSRFKNPRGAHFYNKGSAANSAQVPRSRKTLPCDTKGFVIEWVCNFTNLSERKRQRDTKAERDREREIDR